MLAPHFALIFVVLAACVGVVVALLALVFSMAPGWREERLLALVGGSAAVFSVFNAASYLPSLAMHLRATLTALSFALGVLHIAGWTLYCGKQRGGPLSALDRAVLAVLALLASLALVPHLLLSTRAQVRDVSWLGVRYYDAAPTAWGEVAFLLFAVLLVTAFVRSVLDYRRG